MSYLIERSRVRIGQKNNRTNKDNSKQAQRKETLRIEGNKMNCFPREQSLSDLLYSTKIKTCNGSSNGGRRSTFAGKIVLCISDFTSFCSHLRKPENPSHRKEVPKFFENRLLALSALFCPYTFMAGSNKF